MRRLPPEKQHELRERWLQRHGSQGPRRAVSAATPPPAPAISRRLASALYDLLLTVALAIFVTFPFLAVFGDSTHGWRRHVLQAWVLAAIGAYYVWFWTRAARRCR